METHLWEADNLNNHILSLITNGRAPSKKSCPASEYVWGINYLFGVKKGHQVAQPRCRCLPHGHAGYWTLLAVSFPYQAQQHLTREQL